MRGFLALMIACLFFSSGCEKKEKRMTYKEQRPQVLATTAMIGDLVRTLAGEWVDVQVLIPSTLDPHSYELVKGDDEKLTEADIIFYNGLGLEHGVSVRRFLNHHPQKSICVSKDIPTPLLLEIEGVYDPHLWMDISLWSRVVDPICTALVSRYPSHTETFLQNKELLQKKMEEADQEAYKKMQALPSHKRFLVTSHDAFQYFTKRYLSEAGESNWRRRCTAPEGLAPESELSSIDLMKVFAYIEEHQTEVLFTESNLQAQGIRKLLEAGAKRGLTLRLAKKALYADSMGEARSYLEMIQHNVDLIAEELSQ